MAPSLRRHLGPKLGPLASRRRNSSDLRPSRAASVAVDCPRPCPRHASPGRPALSEQRPNRRVSGCTDHAVSHHGAARPYLAGARLSRVPGLRPLPGGTRNRVVADHDGQVVPGSVPVLGPVSRDARGVIDRPGRVADRSRREISLSRFGRGAPSSVAERPARRPAALTGNGRIVPGR